MSSCNGRLDLAMSILETLSLNDTIGNIVCALSPPQRLLKNMKFEGIEIALEGMRRRDVCAT